MPERPRFTARVDLLPAEPDLPNLYKAVIERALRWAWQRVREEWPEVIRRGSEEQITLRLQWVLNELDENARHRAPGMDAFETIDRGAKTPSAAGNIDKAPDLVVRPIVAIAGVRNRTDWGWFVECKIIGGGSFTPGRYCKLGVARFVVGEYAPRMPSGLLVAYVRDGREPLATLDEPIASWQTRSHAAGATVDTSVSQHERDALATPCVDIVLTHLWLDARL